MKGRFALFSALLIALAGCPNESTPPPDQKKSDVKVVVGVMEPRSGQNAVYGLPASNGALLAFERACAEGLALEVLPAEDSAEGGEKAIQAFDRLCARSPAAIVGPGISQDMLEVGPLAQRRGVVVIGTTCENVRISDLGDCVFRVYPNYRGLARTLAEHVVQDREKRRVAAIAEQSDFGRDFVGIFRERLGALGGEFIKTIEHSPEESNFRGQVLELVALNPEAVLLSSQVAQMVMILQELRAAGYQGLVLAPSSFYDRRSVESVGSGAAGLVIAAYNFDMSADRADLRQFREAYQQRFHEVPEQWAAYGWDAAQTVIAAVRAGARDAGSIKTQLSRGESYVGLTGTFQFDQNGDVAKPSQLYEVAADLSFRPLR